MAWRLAGSLVKLRDQVNAMAPNRNKASDGTIGDASHQAETTGSDHNPNAAGVVNAIDITHSPSTGLDANKLSQSLVSSRDPRIKYIIFNGRAVEPGRFGWSWQPYSGSNPHTSHMHLSVYGNYDDPRNWNIGDQTNQGENEVVDLFTARRIAYAVHGQNGQNGRKNALNGDLDQQLKSWIGRDVVEVLQQAFDDEYGKAYRAEIDQLYKTGNTAVYEEIVGPVYKKRT